MTPSRFPLLAAAIFALATCLSATIQAAPQDHLAPVPQATREEAEVISLLEISTPTNGSVTQIKLPVYNPTRYVLKSCVVRIQVPSRKINRIYSSERATIEPNTDGEFIVQTGIYNPDSREIKVEILKLTYESVKK
jgi:hypothetical protein